MMITDWLRPLNAGLLQGSRPARQPRRMRSMTTTSTAIVSTLEPRVLLSSQPPVDIVAQLEATGAVVDVLPPYDPNLYPAPTFQAAAEGPFPDSQTFQLHSRASATKVIYLDFDGHVTTGTAWNSSTRPTITTPVFDFEGGAGVFTANEHTRIQQVWQRVSEAFSPFDVDVTTEEPPLEDLRNTGTGDDRWGIRVTIGGESQAMLGISAGGVAFLGSFNWDSDTPTFVFTDNLGPYVEKFIADATVHEVGHTLGLNHDGRSLTPVEDYYQGHGTGPTGWAPHMGVGYGKELVQWSRGEYPDANNLEDDLTIITTQNGFTYRPDDKGSTSATATDLTIALGGAVNDGGVIERRTDEDWFRFYTVGQVDLQFDPAVRGAMLDMQIDLYNANGVLISSSNPVDALNGTLSANLAAGTYFLRIDGVGKAANGSDFGYSDYGSIGQYTITGNIQTELNEPPVINNQAFTVPENSPTGTVVGTLLATDPNLGQLLTYSIIAGNTNNTFAVNAQTGQITVNNPALLDFETAPVFNLTVQVSDNGSPILSDFADVTITVTNVNEQPTSQSLTFTTPEDIPLTAFLAGNDPDGTIPTYQIMAQATNGVVALLSNGQFIYTPKANFSGSDAFVYRVSDGQFTSANSTVLITVTPVNDPPTAFPIAITVNANVTSTGRLWSFDPDTPTVTYLLSTAPRAGNVSITASGNFSYTPNLDFFGTDQFEFVVSDGNTLSAPATVTITVLKPNFAPEAYALQLKTNEDTVLNGRLWGFDPEGGSLTYLLTSPPTSGSAVTIQANGNFRYTPKPNFFGRDEFTFIVSDGQRQSKSATIVIDVQPVNDPPTAIPLALSVNEDTALNGGRLWGYDPEGATLTFQLMTLANKGKVTLNADGTFKYQPNANYNGPDQFTFRVSDGSANSSTAIVSLNVLPVNDAPVAKNQVVVTQANTPLNGQLVATDVDLNPLTYSLSVAPTRGRVTLNADGSFVYTPNPNYTGPDLFTYRANDGQANSAIATVSITVQPATAAAVASSTSSTKRTAEDAPGETTAAVAVPVTTVSVDETAAAKDRKLRRTR